MFKSLIVSLGLLSLLAGVVQSESADFILIDSGTIVLREDLLAGSIEVFSFSQASDGTFDLSSATTIDQGDGFVNRLQTLKLAGDGVPTFYLRHERRSVNAAKTIQVTFEAAEATLSRIENGETEEQTFASELDFLILDDTAPSQVIALLRRIQFLGVDRYQFEWIIPTSGAAFPGQAVWLDRTFLFSGLDRIEADVLELSGDLGGGQLVFHLYSEDGRFIGFREQTDEDGEPVFNVYRRDLYPLGIELP